LSQQYRFAGQDESFLRIDRADQEERRK